MSGLEETHEVPSRNPDCGVIRRSLVSGGKPTRPRPIDDEAHYGGIWLMIRRFVNIGVAVLVALSLYSIPATQQFASAAACNNNECNKLDRNSTGCSADAYTVYSAPLAYQGQTWGYVDLRYSPSCGANWARVRAVGTPATLTATVVRDADGLSYFGQWN